jgi:hypothetical protein
MLYENHTKYSIMPPGSGIRRKKIHPGSVSRIWILNTAIGQSKIVYVSKLTNFLSTLYDF